MECNRCGYVIEEGIEVCPNCGKVQAEDRIIQTTIEKKEEENTFLGTELIKEETKNIVTEEKTNGKSTILIFLVVIMGCVCGGFLVYLVSLKNAPKKSVYEDIPFQENITEPVSQEEVTTPQEEVKLCAKKLTVYQYANNYNLKYNSNLLLVNTEAISKAKKETYYLVYEGYTFNDIEFTILTDDNGLVICETDSVKTNDLLTDEELKEKYNTLSDENLRNNLGTTIFSKIKVLNQITSVDLVKSYLSRCNYTDEELNTLAIQMEEVYLDYSSKNTCRYSYFDLKAAIEAVKETN